MKFDIKENQFEQFKQFLEYEVLPLLQGMERAKINKIRGTIKYAKDKVELEKRFAKINKELHLELTTEDLLRAFKKEKGKTKEEENILSLLDEPEIEERYLDLGYVSDSYWYFGFRLDNCDCIITSSKGIFFDRKNNQGDNEILEKIFYKGYIGDIAPTLLRKTVKRLLESKNDNLIDDVGNTYLAIRDKILYYMDFGGKDEIADVLACWIICTYCYPLFHWFPHLLINAPSGSGKSKCGQLITQLSFRGFDLGASGGVTPAQIFRTLEGNRGTILIDEFETRRGDVGRDSQQLVNQILNASASRDAYVIRNEQVDKKWRASKFPVFCPKVVCNISGINATSLSRFIPFQWLKTNNAEKSSRKPIKQKDKESLKEIAQDVHLLIFENWKEIKDSYEHVFVPSLQNRDEDNWLPLFAIAKFIQRKSEQAINIETKLLKYIEESKALEVETEDPVGEVLRIIYNNISEQESYFSPKEMALFPGMEELIGHYKSPPTYIGKKLRLYQFKPTRHATGMKYKISKKSIGRILTQYFPSQLDTLLTEDTLVGVGSVGNEGVPIEDEEVVTDV